MQRTVLAPLVLRKVANHRAMTLVVCTGRYRTDVALVAGGGGRGLAQVCLWVPFCERRGEVNVFAREGRRVESGRLRTPGRDMAEMCLRRGRDAAEVRPPFVRSRPGMCG